MLISCTAELEADLDFRLRKEWFLLLIREVFDPAHGMPVPQDAGNVI